MKIKKQGIALLLILLFNSCVPAEENPEDITEEIIEEVVEEETDKDIEPHGNSASVGLYNNGRLINGESLLSRADGVHKLFTQRKRSYGTQELIDTIVAISDVFSSRYDNIEKIQVGDLSNKKGGAASPNHSSHQSGLDADIVYLSRSHKLQGQANPYWTQYFVTKGKISSNFDQERNWELFKFIVEEADVNRIFVDPVIKKTMCKYAEKIGEKYSHREVLRRLRPLNQHHEHHFHLRLKCPKGDNECRDQSPPPQGSGC